MEVDNTKQEGFVQENNKDSKVDIRVDLSPDSYSAMLTITSIGTINRISKNVILDRLKDKKVIYGIDMQKINTICLACQPVQNEIIATGRKHINGEDGRIEYKIDLPDAVKPKILEDGTVDFKDMNKFVFVKRGQILAEKIEPTEGQEGYTVTGKTVKQRTGKQKSFSIGKNIAMVSDGTKIASLVDGSIKMEGHKISVIEVLDIMGDVGVKTGNIEFKGKVIVRGNVLTGYSINCDGDLEVQGVVEAANLLANGDMVISRGIQGQDEAKIKCGGNLISKFLNNCSVDVKGDIEADAIMHSDIFCNGSVHASGRKGHIVGGVIKAKDEIRANKIGSPMGTITKLTMGMDVESARKYEQLSKQMKEIKENIKKTDQVINLLNKKIEMQPNDTNNKILLNKTNSSKQGYLIELKKITEEYMLLQEELNHQEGNKIFAKEIYPGTMISIGQTHSNIKNAIREAEIGKFSGEIKINALKGE